MNDVMRIFSQAAGVEKLQSHNCIRFQVFDCRSLCQTKWRHEFGHVSPAFTPHAKLDLRQLPVVSCPFLTSDL